MAGGEWREEGPIGKGWIAGGNGDEEMIQGRKEEARQSGRRRKGRGKDARQGGGRHGRPLERS